MSLKTAIRDIFGSRNWARKLLIYIFISVIPVLNWVAVGYVVQLAQNVTAKKEWPLPEWDDWERYFENGARVVGGMVVYFLPVLAAWFTASAAMGTTSSRFGALGVIVVFIAFVLTGYAMLLPGLWPMLFIQVARRETVSACWQWNEMWQMVRGQTNNYVILMSVYVVFVVTTLYFTGWGFFTLTYITGSLVILKFLLFAWFVVISILWSLLLVVMGPLEGQFIIQAEKKLKRWRKRKGM